MGNTTDIKLSCKTVDNLWQSVHGRDLSGFFDKLNEKLFFHNVSIHEDVAFLSASTVLFDGFNTFLFIQVQNITVDKFFSCVIYRLIQKSDICFRINVCLKELGVILRIYHVRWCDDHIWLMHTLDEFDVFVESSDICVVYVVFSTVLCEHKLKFAAFGVDVVMTAGSEVSSQRTRFVSYIYLNVVNSTIAHI